MKPIRVITATNYMSAGNIPLERLESRFKSIVQQFNSRMTNNNLTEN